MRFDHSICQKVVESCRDGATARFDGKTKAHAGGAEKRPRAGAQGDCSVRGRREERLEEGNKRRQEESRALSLSLCVSLAYALDANGENGASGKVGPNDWLEPFQPIKGVSWCNLTGGDYVRL